jgi:SAM-dependent methyltransferase
MALEAYSKTAVEERTRHWLEAQYLSALGTLDAGRGVYDAQGQLRALTQYGFQEVQRKLKIFRWLERFQFDSFIDVGSGFDYYPTLVHERYGVPAYFSDFAHSMNLPYGGDAFGKLDHAVTLNIARLPFADDSFDVVLSSEVLEHLVRPVEAIAELLRVARKYVIMTSLEALSASRWQRWLSHVRVDVRQPHVERNFFLLHELAAIFGPDWQHENLFYDPALPAGAFESPAARAAAYAALRDVPAFAAALGAAIRVTDHRPGSMGILIVKAKPGTAIGPPSADDLGLARWLIERTGVRQAALYRLAEQIRAGSAPFAAPDRPIADDLLARLRCPDCLGTLERAGAGLRCANCAATFPVEYGVPRLYPLRVPEPRPEREWLPRLCGDDPERRRLVQRVARRLRNNEVAPGPLRRLVQRAL